MPLPDYRRLTSKTRSVGGYSQLWLADDHLLVIDSSRFNENYRRFRLADIRAISVTDGPNLVVFQVLAGLAAIGWGMLALAVNAIAAKWFFGISGGLLLLLALADVARGPRCRCLLYTAVSQQRLRAVSRQTTARSFLAALTPAIEGVQGTLAAQDIEAGADSAAAPPIAPSPRFAAAQALFGLYLLDALVAAIIYLVPRAGASVIFPASILGEFMLAIITLVKPATRLIRTTTGLAIAGMALGLYDLFTLGRLIWAAALRGALQGPTPPDFNALLAPSLRGIVFACAWRIAIGAVGLILFAQAGRRKSPE
jgi:hypothetical protein